MADWNADDPRRERLHASPGSPTPQARVRPILTVPGASPPPVAPPGIVQVLARPEALGALAFPCDGPVDRQEANRNL